MTEVWKEVPGYPLYEVSDHGRIRSWKNGRHGRRKEPRLLKAGPDCDGYRRVSLYKEGQIKTVKVHSLVLTTFVGPCPVGLQCCHGDGVQIHNHLSNLRWDTSLANTQDALSHGTRITPRGEAHHNSKLTEADVVEIRRVYAAGGVTQAALGARFGVARSVIGFVLRGETWAHVGGVPQRGRPYVALGEVNRAAKLTEADVVEICRVYAAGGVTQAALGARFGVCPQTVSFVLRGETWAHVTRVGPDEKMGNQPAS